jgi:hypothetical protein
MVSRRPLGHEDGMDVLRLLATATGKQHLRQQYLLS